MMRRSGGRRGMRAELESTWTVYDAARPIRREDMAEPSPPVVATPSRDPNRALEPDEGATCFACGNPEGVHQQAPTPRQRLRFSIGEQVDICDECLVRMNAAEPPIMVTGQPDAVVAKVFGVSEMDVREARRWAAEQAERLEGATLTEANPAVKH